MKVVILAGGRGTRMQEETQYIPKPMVEIGGKPILWHIMKIYSAQGFNDFIICLGYKGSIIKQYFLNYNEMNYDFEIHVGWGSLSTLQDNDELDWNVILTDTGLDTQTGSRLKKVQKYLKNEPFLLTYGDGVADINLDWLQVTHKHNRDKFGALATITTVLSKSKFGEVEFNNNGLIKTFEEKSKTSWINGGFMICEPEALNYIEGENDPLEGGMLTRLTKVDKLGYYNHNGFWGCMDNAKEILALDELCKTGNPPWKMW